MEGSVTCECARDEDGSVERGEAAWPGRGEALCGVNGSGPIGVRCVCRDRCGVCWCWVFSCSMFPRSASALSCCHTAFTGKYHLRLLGLLLPVFTLRWLLHYPGAITLLIITYDYFLSSYNNGTCIITVSADGITTWTSNLKFNRYFLSTQIANLGPLFSGMSET